MSYLSTLSVDDAFSRYEDIRHRFPEAQYPRETGACNGLVEIADAFDAFLLDGFGVLNVGETAIPGAIKCWERLSALGKRLIILTNAASYTSADAAARYRRLGFNVTEDQVVSSRDVCVRRLEKVQPEGRWGAIATNDDRLEDIPVDVIRWSGQHSGDVDGFLFLSSAALGERTLADLEEALSESPRPFVIANPDLVAPRETGLSKEPGFYANAIADRLGVVPTFFGKPYGHAFEDALGRLEGIDRNRIAMVGDTLHTDILGGSAAGLRTVLVRDHGLLAGRAASGYVMTSGIVPDFSCPGI